MSHDHASRVSVLAAEYDRWYAFYRHLGSLAGDALPEVDEAGAIARLHELIDEITITPARSLHDFGLKARIVREYMGPHWYDHGSKSGLSEGVDLARAMMVELIAINNLQPMPVSDPTPQDLLPGYVEPPIGAAPVLPKFRVIEGGDLHARRTGANTGCFVANMAASFKDTLDAFNTACDGSSNAYLNSVADSLEASMRSMLKAVPYMETESAAGSVFQLAVANSAPEIILECVDPNDPNYLQIKEQVDRIQWALWSVRTFIEAQYGVDGRDLGCDYNMPTTRNPFQCVRDLTRSVRDEPKAQTEFRQAAE